MDRGHHFIVVIAVVIVAGACQQVGFALVPDGAAHRETGEGGDHGIEQNLGTGEFALAGSLNFGGGRCACRPRRIRSSPPGPLGW